MNFEFLDRGISKFSHGRTALKQIRECRLLITVEQGCSRRGGQSHKRVICDRPLHQKIGVKVLINVLSIIYLFLG